MTKSELTGHRSGQIKKFKFKYPNKQALFVIFTTGQTEEVEFKDLTECFKWLNRPEFKNKELVIVDTRNNDIEYHYYIIGDENYNYICKQDNLLMLIVGQKRPSRTKFGAKIRYGRSVTN